MKLRVMVHIEAPPAGTRFFFADLMTDSIVFKYAPERELERLAGCFSVDDCKRVLREIFGGREIARDDESEGFLIDLHFHAYGFCREQRFSTAQTSVLLGIHHALMERDLAADSRSTLRDSYARFESLLLAHSVDRSPKSVMLFSPAQAAAIVDFVTHTYFRHFELYKSVFTPFRRVFLVQKDASDVQTPRAPRPLAEGFLHVAPAQDPELRGTETDDDGAASDPV